jgi:phosphoribosylformylglycinamidine synthase subunit PurL
MASRGGTGIEIDLARIPQRESGMTPYEIMLSESQERMLLVAEKGREPEVLQVFKKWGLDAVVVGEVADGGLLRVKDHGVVVAEIPAHPLAEEGPVYQRPISRPAKREESAADWFVFTPEKKILTNNFKRLLASPAISSKRWITEQYDTMVRTNTLAVPGAGDAAVVRIKGTKRALALATDGNGRWCQLNPRLGAMHAVAEAARNVACSGAKPIAATNCLNFGSPEKPEVMWQFSEAIDGLGTACNELETPITGGNVSFYNETLGSSIYPTPVIGILGVIEDATNVLKMAFRDDGDIVILLDGIGRATDSPAVSSNGSNAQLAREFSSSEYSKTVGGFAAGEPPAIDLPAEKRLQQCMVALAASRAIQSAHDISDGGLAVTLAESCFASAPARKAGDTLGANLKIKNGNPAESAVFGERGARAVISVSPASLDSVVQTAQKYGVSAVPIGEVTANGIFRIELNGSAIIEEPVETLRDIWAHSLERALRQ